MDTALAGGVKTRKAGFGWLEGYRQGKFLTRPAVEE